MKKITIFGYKNALKSIKELDSKGEDIYHDEVDNELSDEHGNHTNLCALPDKNVSFLIDDDKLVIDDDGDIKFHEFEIPPVPLKIITDACEDLDYYHHSLFKVEDYVPVTFPTKKIVFGIGALVIGVVVFNKIK